MEPSADSLPKNPETESTVTESDSNGASVPPGPSNRTGGQRPRRFKRTRPMRDRSRMSSLIKRLITELVITALLLLPGSKIDVDTPNIKIHFEPQQSAIVLIYKLLLKQ